MHTYSWIKARDSSRPVQYERAVIDPRAVTFDRRYWGRVDSNTDLLVPMYPYPTQLERCAPPLPLPVT